MKRLQEMTTAELMVLCHKIANNPAADEDTRKKAYKYALELSAIAPPRSPVDEEKDAAIMNCAIEFIELNLYLT